MTSVKIGDSVLVADSMRTKHIYESIPAGASDACGCSYCRNYRAQVPHCFPQEVIDFFNGCGIDINKEADVSELSPLDCGSYLYAGEFFFICSERPKIDSGKLNERFEYSILRPTPMQPEQFSGEHHVMCFSFVFTIDWVLDDSP